MASNLTNRRIAKETIVAKTSNTAPRGEVEVEVDEEVGETMEPGEEAGGEAPTEGEAKELGKNLQETTKLELSQPARSH